MKVYELLKKRLETGLIEMSDSAWASLIVIVLMKNGVDIRMCIDYRLVNSFIELLNYPLPLMDDLLVGFEQAMSFMPLDMASGFWAIRMTERAKRISAFLCPFGHFQWIRMPFGLMNAPLIYQEMNNNCLWGFVRLPPEEEKTVDADVLKFLGLNSADEEEVQREKSAREVPILTDNMTAFKRNIPASSQMGPVLGRSSYIDDIAHGAPTWDQLCEDLNALLYRLRYWNISVSLPKSESGKLTIPAEGIRTIPKIAKSVQELPFPTTLKGVQSFLGSRNYYHKFIEDFSVVAAGLHELTDEQIKAGRDLSSAKESFEILKRKIVSTPLLRHPDRYKLFVIIPHANRWAVCAGLGQEYDGKILPVRFPGRVLNETEIRYHEAEKEVIAIMRLLDVFENLVRGCPIKVYTRYSVLSWLLKSKSANGRCVRWGVILSHWDLEVHKVQSDEDGLVAIMRAGITPREHLDEVGESLIPLKGQMKPQPGISVGMLEADFDGYVLSFDGAAKTATRQGSCGCIIWKLPVTAQGFILEEVTVNDAEYHGLLKSLTMVAERDIPDVVVVGDTRIVIQQVQMLINCNQPNLQRRLAEYGVLREKFKSVRLVHVKREYNQAADYLT
ncbi:reverse transcriptase [Phytophthora megakarya]|uniref:Reverse transcriptase n=1 Tax=Phytophthora megakarya TaxID=4795 RepID=A0A225V284_9STRA|nr:reverse transcriptase [Phytophthora megakarya]